MKIYDFLPKETVIMPRLTKRRLWPTLLLLTITKNQFIFSVVASVHNLSIFQARNVVFMVGHLTTSAFVSSRGFHITQGIRFYVFTHFTTHTSLRQLLRCFPLEQSQDKSKSHQQGVNDVNPRHFAKTQTKRLITNDTFFLGIQILIVATHRGSDPIQMIPPLPIKEVIRFYDVGAELWSATSYKKLRENALGIERANRLRVEGTALAPDVTVKLANVGGPIIAVTDFMKSVPEQISRWVPDQQL